MSTAGTSEAGFTLLEALVVVAIVGLVAALVAPNIGASLDLLSLRESASIMQADLRVARATALRTGSKVAITPVHDSRGDGYDWIGGTRHFPGTVRLRMSGPVSFMADGSMIPADITVTSGGRHIPIAINSTTGAITAGGR